jgi:WD40 repeat protein
MQLRPMNVKFYQTMCELKSTYKEGISCVAYGTQKHLLACAYDSGAIVVWNLAKQKIVRVLEKHFGPVFSLQWAPFGTQELLSSGRDGTVRIWSIEDGTCRVSLRDHASNAMTCAMWSDDGQMLATTGKSRHILVYNLSRAKVNGIDLNTASRSALMLDVKPKGPKNSRGHTAMIRKLLWTHDNFHVISASDDSTIISWNVAEKGCFDRVFVGHTQAVNDICLDAPGKTLLSCSLDGTVKIWEYEHAECLRTLKVGHIGGVLSAQWIPYTDSRRIASSGEDRAVCVWEATTGLLMQKLECLHSTPAQSISFRGDGVVFATGSADSAVMLQGAIKPGALDMCGWSTYSCGVKVCQSATNLWCCKRRADPRIYVGDTHLAVSTATAFPTIRTLSRNFSTQDTPNGLSSDAIAMDGSYLVGAPKQQESIGSLKFS